MRRSRKLRESVIPPEPAGSQTVVLVHGLWMAGFELSVLRSRLRRSGFRVFIFSYSSWRATLDDNAVALWAYVKQLNCPVIHFAGVSLGGLVCLRALEIADGLPPGRVVLIGSPVQGSAVARRLSRYSIGRWYLGRSLGVLAESDRPWVAARETGVISGDRSWGPGRLIGGLEGPNDGTVMVRETQLNGAADNVRICATHFGLPFARKTASRVGHFFQYGYF